MVRTLLTAGLALGFCIGITDWGEFEAQVKAFRVDKKTPGLAIGVVKDEKLAWSIGLGYADSNRTVPVTTDTPFWIASVTKTLVGLA